MSVVLAAGVLSGWVLCGLDGDRNHVGPGREVGVWASSDPSLGHHVVDGWGKTGDWMTTQINAARWIKVTQATGTSSMKCVL